MAWAQIRSFNNQGEGANAAGVCEAAVCLWLGHIAAYVAQPSFNERTFNFLPETGVANALYNEFERNPKYIFRYASYLKLDVFPTVSSYARKLKDKISDDEYVQGSCHYFRRMEEADANRWQQAINDMECGDALFVDLLNDNKSVGHAIGVYKGCTHIWIFDPNSGLHQGLLSDDVPSAASDLAQYTAGSWKQGCYYGIHMRQP